MQFNPKMFKQKKKRAVDPNAPPRPNLLSQDKKLREQQTVVGRLQSQISQQAEEIASLKSKYADMQQSVNQIVNYLRKGK
jgi:DNA-binding transcriptional regulator GbsR (MarR family)